MVSLVNLKMLHNFIVDILHTLKMQNYRNGEWIHGYQEAGMVVEYEKITQESSFMGMKQF